MADVTDCVFRRLIAKYGKPDVMWTEFVSADGLMSPGGRRLLADLKFTDEERPIVAQLFSGRPEAMRRAAALVRRLGFDGLDINMGCPDRAVERQGGGAALIKNRKLAVEILEAARRGAGGTEKRHGRNGIPVSIKTRLGYDKVDLDWIGLLIGQDIPALTVHLRTRGEMSDVPARWEIMPDIVKLRDAIQKDVPKSGRALIIGNGDVESPADARAKCDKYGCDGVMIGRGIFGEPWLFEGMGKGRDMEKRQGKRERKPEERLAVMLEHARLFDKQFCGRRRLKNFAVMRKHFKAYVSGWDGAGKLRGKLMEAKNAGEVSNIVESYLKGARIG